MQGAQSAPSVPEPPDEDEPPLEVELDVLPPLIVDTADEPLDELETPVPELLELAPLLEIPPPDDNVMVTNALVVPLVDAVAPSAAEPQSHSSIVSTQV